VRITGTTESTSLASVIKAPVLSGGVIEVDSAYAGDYTPTLGTTVGANNINMAGNAGGGSPPSALIAMSTSAVRRPP